MSEIAGKRILITGGAGGIGRLMALEMAKLGGTLVLWDIAEERLQRTVEEVRGVGPGAHGYVCDVSDRHSVYDAADKVKAEVGDVDILVNNAGIVSGNSFLDIPDEQIEATLGVNVLSMFWTGKAFLPAMIDRNSGHVVNIASAAGLIGVARLSDYSASKFAAIGFDESLRVELKRTAPGVRTTVVCPYYIDTGMFEGVKTRFSFLLPILKEEEVAHRIVDAVGRNKERVIMPPMVYLVPILRALPPSAFDLVANLFGINVSMDEFVGHGRSK